MKSRSLVLPVASLALSSLAACSAPAPLGPTPDEPHEPAPPTNIALGALDIDAAGLQGLAVDPARGTFHVLVERRGIVELNRDGEVVGERPVGVDGLADLPYRDLVVMSDERVLLIADSEGYVWDPLTASLRVHFCVEPGFIECTDENGQLVDTDGNGVCDWDECISEGALIDSNGDAVCDWEQCYRNDGSVYARDANGLCEGDEPVPTPDPEPTPEPTEPLVQQNDALALAGTTILAAPRFFDEGVQVEAALRRYDLFSGTPVGGADLTGLDLDVMGLAASEDGLVGVEAGRIVLFDDAGRVVGARPMSVEEPVGAAVVDGELLVLDRETQRIVGFSLNDE